jgi:hypothetical protein
MTQLTDFLNLTARYRKVFKAIQKFLSVKWKLLLLHDFLTLTMDLTATEKAQCVELFIECGKSVTIFQRKYRQKHGIHCKAPRYRVIMKWYNKFKQGEGMHRKKRKSKQVRIIFCGAFFIFVEIFLSFQWIRTDEKAAEVLESFKQNPHCSLRRLANIEGMPSVGTIHAILKAAKFHPYIMQIHQTLTPQDHRKRVAHAQQQLQQMETNPYFLESLLFSDEAHFHINGNVNTHNFRFWSQSNPAWCQEKPLHSPRITVWAGIGCHGVVGPFFFHQNVNGLNYLQMIQQEFLPVVQQWDSFHSLIFMQDGAPPHWSTAVRNFLSAVFPNRWMGRGSPNLPWPPYSPDLTPCDFFLWGWIKSQVYTTPIANLVELRTRIELAFASLSMQMTSRAVCSYKNRLNQCISVGGRSVEVWKK